MQCSADCLLRLIVTPIETEDVGNDQLLRACFIESRTLTKSEWLFGLAMMIFLFSFLIIAKKTSFRSLGRLHQVMQPLPVSSIIVDITGDVKKTGKMNVSQGSTIRSVIRKARLKSTADLTNIDLDRVLDASCDLHIPAFEKIVVEVCGCVKEKVSIELPAGSRICDMKGCVVLSENADPSFFRRRKILRNNEIIRVPALDEKKSSKH